MLVHTGWHIGPRRRRDPLRGRIRHRQVATIVDRTSCKGRSTDYRINIEHNSTHVVIYLTRLEDEGWYLVGCPWMPWGSEKLDRIVL